MIIINCGDGWGMLTIVFIIVGFILVTSGFILNEIRRLMRQVSQEHYKDKEVIQE